MRHDRMYDNHILIGRVKMKVKIYIQHFVCEFIILNFGRIRCLKLY